MPSKLQGVGLLLLAVSNRFLVNSSSFCEESEDGVWKTVFEENFDGNALDESIWNVVVADEGAGSFCRSAACTTDAVYLDNGFLVLKSDAIRANGAWINITSGAVHTKGKQTWNTTGREFRLCVTAILPGGDEEGGQGIWPAHWLMPSDSSCDPDEGEMDIMEMIDGDGTVWTTYHWESTFPEENCSYPDGHLEGYGSIVLDGSWGEMPHEFGVERGTEHLAFVVDGITTANSSDPTNWPSEYNGQDSSKPLFWDVNWYLILNTAVGGSWPGEANSTTIFPTYHRIDRVRVVTRELPQ